MVLPAVNVYMFIFSMLITEEKHPDPAATKPLERGFGLMFLDQVNIWEEGCGESKLSCFRVRYF